VTSVARLLIVPAAALLSACSATSHCKGKLDYQEAPSVPPLAGVEALKLPESPSALRIPPPPEQPVAFGEKYQNEKGKERYRCLDVPPRMDVPEDAKDPDDKNLPKPKKPDTKSLY